jgi:predicted phosphodiesterase
MDRKEIVFQRVAALYDIHGNLPALEAVLDEVARAGVDAVVVGGDVVPGPMPRETLARLRELRVPVLCVRGNGEREVLARMAGLDSGAVPEAFREIVGWVADQLDPDDGRWLSTWGQTLRLRVRGLGEVVFCHATPRDDDEIVTRTTPENRLEEIYHGIDVSLVVCGHTHMPFDRTVGAIRVVNAGSVGMPFGPVGADWLLLGPEVEPRRTSYDLAAAAARIAGTAYPGAEGFAARHVLDPPTEAEMLEAFERRGAG